MEHCSWNVIFPVTIAWEGYIWWSPKFVFPSVMNNFKAMWDQHLATKTAPSNGPLGMHVIWHSLLLTNIYNTNQPHQIVFIIMDGYIRTQWPTCSLTGRSDQQISTTTRMIFGDKSKWYDLIWFFARPPRAREAERTQLQYISPVKRNEWWAMYLRGNGSSFLRREWRGIRDQPAEGRPRGWRDVGEGASFIYIPRKPSGCVPS